MNNCCYVLSSNERCGAKVSYKFGLDDDKNKRRNYNNFCQTHNDIVMEIARKIKLYADEFAAYKIETYSDYIVVHHLSGTKLPKLTLNEFSELFYV